MDGIQKGKRRLRRQFIEMLIAQRVDPGQLTFQWGPADETWDEGEAALPRKTHTLLISRGAKRFSIGVCESDLERGTFDNLRERYERFVVRALMDLCGNKMCREG